MSKTTLGDVAQYINGRAFKPTEWEDTGLPIIRIQNLTNTKQDCNRTTREYESKYLVHDGDLLFAWSASLGAHIWHGGSGWLNQHIFRVVPNKGTDKLYLYYYLLHIVDVLYGKTHGSGMVHITIKPFKNTEIYLPSLSEQQRIVDRIESLFAKLDEAKEKAQAALDSFETRKAAILHKAFTGELTAKWREENGVRIESWKTTTVKAICDDIKVGIVIKPSQYYTSELDGTPAFRSANVREFHVDNCDWVYLNSKGQSENQRSIVHTGDVLIVRSGTPGTACVVTKEFNGFNAIDILIAVPNPNLVTSDFLCAFTNSPIGRKLVAENKRGMALAHFNVGGYSQLPICLPILQEQIEIVRLLDAFFAKEQKAKELCSVLDKIDLIKKSILARAFRGELGTNDPTEESALQLLKSIV